MQPLHNHCWPRRWRFILHLRQGLLEDWATEAPLNFTAANESQIHTESVEDLIAKNLANDMKDINRLPDMENTSNNSESSREHHGFGELTKNLEFMMLKLAQLETIAELQQAEIKGLKEENQAIKTEIQALKGNSSDPTVSAAQLKAKEAEKVKEAQEVFKKVVQKHLHQRLEAQLCDSTLLSLLSLLSLTLCSAQKATPSTVPPHAPSRTEQKQGRRSAVAEGQAQK